MAKRKRGPAPLQGRAKKQAAMALGRTTEAVRNPLKPILGEEKNEYDETVTVTRRTVPRKDKIGAELLALASGGINLGQVNSPAFEVSPAQRRPALYSPEGRIKLEDRQLTLPEDWQMMQEPGVLIVVSGLLNRINGTAGTARFDFEPQTWAVATEEQHLAASSIPNALRQHNLFI